MKQIHSMVVSKDLRAAAGRVAARLGPIQIVAPKDWQHVVEQLGTVLSTDPDGTCLVVGSPAFVLKHAAAAVDPFGLVMPVAQRSKPWRRSMSWRDDATLALWRAGWSPRAIDRVLIPIQDAVVEFVIGDVRRTPHTANQPDGAATG